MIEEPTETLSRGAAKHFPSNGNREAALLREYYSEFVTLPRDRKRNFERNMCQLMKTSMLLCFWVSLIAFLVCMWCHT